MEKSVNSFQEKGLICAYSANTDEGTMRNYNEDRVSIIINLTKSKKDSPGT